MLKKIIKTHKKVLSIILIFLMTFSLLEATITWNTVSATSNRYIYNGNNLDTNTYRGFKEKIDALKSAHPAWNFVIMETGLDWNQTIVAESSFAGSSPYSLIQGKGGNWICSSCGDKAYDNGSWYHASENAIKYYMDARNWLNDTVYLLQFLQLGYVETSDENIYNALNGTFLYSMDNARAINNACKNKQANLFFIIARILQEQSANGSATYKMTDGDGNVYYNLFNIGASGNGTDQIIANALATAKSRGWTSVQSSIEGGIQVLFNGYLSNKQDTLYLNKFDVESYNGVYRNQYMQNIEAPISESKIMYNKIKNTELLNQTLTFVIPVFYNMPAEACTSPDGAGEIGPKNIKIKDGHSEINVREQKSTSSNIVSTIYDSNTVILSSERYGDGWHRVVLENGTQGYIFFNTEYFEEINDITNCSEQMTITGDEVCLRAGPSRTQSVITTLANGQQLTRIDNTGRYNIDGITWDRVVLADGRQGFVSRDYLKNADYSEIFTVKADGGLFLRTAPNGYNIRLLDNGSTVTRIEIGSNEFINGYQWDKVATPDGAVGYVARKYLRDQNGNEPSGKEETPTVPDDGNQNAPSNSKKDDEKRIITMEPNTSENNLKTSYGNDIIITKQDGSSISDGVIGTGYKITINGTEYIAIKLGDSNGDGTINSLDALETLKLSTSLITKEEIYRKAMDTNNDGTINSLDALKILKSSVNLDKISLN